MLNVFLLVKIIIDVMYTHVNVDAARQEHTGGNKKLKVVPGQKG